MRHVPICRDAGCSKGLNVQLRLLNQHLLLLQEGQRLWRRTAAGEGQRGAGVLQGDAHVVVVVLLLLLLLLQQQHLLVLRVEL